MPSGIAYALGVLSGVVLLALVQKKVEQARKAAKREGYKECEYHQSIRTEAFNRGYDRARKDYRNMSEVERFAETFNGHKVKMQMRGAVN